MDMQSKAKKLIEMIQTAPVEWKPLGEVAKVLRGKRLTKKELIEGGKYPVFHGGLIPLGWFDQFNRRANQTMIINTGSIGEVIWSGVDFWSSDGTFVIQTPNYLDDKFIFYFLKTREGYLKSQKRVGGVPTIDRLVVENISIPIPPLETQQKIVKILDKFTKLEATLEATLEAELALRKRQYQYYRDFLLDFDNQIWVGIADGYKGRLKDVVWKTLGEVTLPTENIKWKHTDKIYQYIDLTSVSRENKTITDTIAISANNAPSRAQKIVKEHDVIFATTRPTLQRFTIISKKFSGEIASTGYCVLRANCKEVLPKWIYYQISTERFNQYVEVNQSGSAYPAISDVKVKEFKIPTPPLPEQEKITAILDKFDTLTHSISEGLPYEIALRRKQYEYYRGQLLSFSKAA